MEKSKGEVMNHVLTKLQDVQNSQKALIEKMASIQIELFDMPDAELEKSVETALGTVLQAADELNPAVEQYEMKVNVENQNHGPSPEGMA